MNKEKWEIKKLGEVCDIINGRNQKKVEDPNGSYPIMGSGGIMGYANEYLCPKNTVIIGRKGTINNPFIVSDNVWIVDTAFGFIANNSVLNSHFLNFFCKSFDFNRLNVAVTIPSLRKIDLKEINIPIPPLSTQEKIVSELDTLHRLKELQEQQLAELDNLAQYTFYHLFGDPIENEKGWEKLPWESVFYTTTGKLNANQMSENGKFPFFTCSKEVFKIDYYDFDCEALILAGNNATANYDIKHYKGKFNAYQRTYILTLKNSNHSYLLFKFQLENKLDLMQQLSIGINTKYLTLKILFNFDFFIPPLSLQTHFSERIEKIEAQKALIKQSIGETQLLIDYTMDKYFG